MIITDGPTISEIILGDKYPLLTLNISTKEGCNIILVEGHHTTKAVVRVTINNNNELVPYIEVPEQELGDSWLDYLTLHNYTKCYAVETHQLVAVYMYAPLTNTRYIKIMRVGTISNEKGGITPLLNVIGG